MPQKVFKAHSLPHSSDRVTELVGALDPTLNDLNVALNYGMAIGGTMFRGPRPWVDVRAFGAKGDNVTDDTAAINSAISSIRSTGGVVFLPAGVYSVSNLNMTNAVSVNLVGQSMYSTVLTANTTASGGNALTDHVIDLTGAASCYLRDFAIQVGGGITPTTALFLANSTTQPGSAIVMARIQVTGTYTKAVYYNYKTLLNTVRDCLFYTSSTTEEMVILTDGNVDGLDSALATVSNSATYNPSDIIFDGCQLFHSAVGNAAAMVYLEDVSRVTFHGGLFISQANAAAGSAYIQVHDLVNSLVFVDTGMINNDGVAAPVYGITVDGGATLQQLRFVGASPAVGTSVFNNSGTINFRGANRFIDFTSAQNNFVNNGYLGVTQSTNYNGVARVSPGSCVLSGLRVVLDAAPGAGNTVVFTLHKNAVATAMTCTVSGAVNTTCSDDTHVVELTANDTYAIRVTLTGAPATFGYASVGQLPFG